MKSIMENNFKLDRLLIAKYETKGELPNPFIFENGNSTKNITDWKLRKREIYKTAVELQFGALPPIPELLDVEILNLGKNHRTYKIHTGTYENSISFIMKVILPKGNNRPVIINGDMCSGYFMRESFVETATKKDVGWVFFDRTELAHDVRNEGRRNGALYRVFPEYSFGAIAAWAWGYSRCIDALEKLKLPQIDMSCIAFTGHSRGGKAAILAGAVDERAYIVNPNEACLAGGGCYRIRMVGEYKNLLPWRSETLKDIWDETGFWLGENMQKYVENEENLPFDAHYLKAMIAPRVLFVSEASGDIWANPVGSWMTTIAAGEVFKFLNAEQNLYWYFREGTHYHTTMDIEKLVSIVCHIHDGDKLEEGFYEAPFELPKLLYTWSAPNCKIEKEKNDETIN